MQLHLLLLDYLRFGTERSVRESMQLCTYFARRVAEVDVELDGMIRSGGGPERRTQANISFVQADITRKVSTANGNKGWPERRMDSSIKPMDAAKRHPADSDAASRHSRSMRRHPALSCASNCCSPT
jgi:hypothetical protein